jgi:hypothetical protein
MRTPLLEAISPGTQTLPTRSSSRALALALAITLMLVSGAPVAAQGYVYKSGNDLLESLRQATGLEHAYALNYIAGVVDATSGSATKEGFCFDLTRENLKMSQVADVVLPFLERNPQMRDRPASLLVAAALAEKWPCR